MENTPTGQTPPGEGMQRWLAAVLLVAVLLPSAWLAWTWRAMPHVGYYHDDALYLVGAKSLAEGGGYRIASLPGQPYQTKYPPLYPALVSLIWRLDPRFPANLPKVMLFSWICFAASVLLARSLVRQCGETDARSIVIAGLLALSPVAVLMSLMAMSEILFCGLVFAALIMAERGRAGWAGWLAGLAFLARGAALPFLISAPAVFLWQRRDLSRAVRFAAAMFPAVAAWQIWTELHRAPAGPLTLYYTDYVGFHRYDVPFSDWPQMIADNANIAAKSIGELLISEQDNGFAALTLTRVLAAAAISGVVRLVRAGRFVHYAAFALLYLAQLMLWNYPPGQRFLLPLLPLIVAGFWREMQSLGGIVAAAWAKRGTDRAVAAVICTLLAWLGVSAAGGLARGLYSQVPAVLAEGAAANEEVRDAYRWIEKNAAAGSVLLSFRDPVDYLHTGRRGYSLRIPPGIVKRGDSAEIRRFLAPLPDLAARHAIDYVVLTSTDYSRDLPEFTVPAYRAVFKDKDRFEPVYELGATKLYRVRPLPVESSRLSLRP